MFYSITLATVFYSTMTIWITEGVTIASVHPITECTRYVYPLEPMPAETPTVYECNTEKLYASMTGIEFVTIKVSGVYEI